MGTRLGILRMWITGAEGEETRIGNRRGTKGLGKCLIKGLEKKGDRWERQAGFQKGLGRPYFSSLEVWVLQGLALEEQG